VNHAGGERDGDVDPGVGGFGHASGSLTSLERGQPETEV
jgi:hypothetical protein